MKNILFVILSSLLLLVGCGYTSERMIPDDTLKHMLVDIAFMDAYTGIVGVNLKKDSIEAFAPIFEKYGYTSGDLTHTLAQHSQRNSKVLPKMIENAIEELAKEQKVVKWRNTLNEKWIDAADKHYTKQIFAHPDTIILNNKDSMHLVVFKVPIKDDGKVEVSYRYSQDSTDYNAVRYFRYQLLDSVTSKQYRTNSAWLSVSKNRFRDYSHTIKLNENNDLINQLSLELIYFGNGNKSVSKPNVMFDSLQVSYTPPTAVNTQKYMYKKLGLDSLYNLVDGFKTSLMPKISREWWSVKGDSLLVDSLLRERVVIDSLREVYIDSLSIEIAKDAKVEGL